VAKYDAKGQGTMHKKEVLWGNVAAAVNQGMSKETASLRRIAAGVDGEGEDEEAASPQHKARAQAQLTELAKCPGTGEAAYTGTMCFDKFKYFSEQVNLGCGGQANAQAHAAAQAQAHAGAQAHTESTSTRRSTRRSTSASRSTSPLI
jgi:hypothetical protein